MARFRAIGRALFAAALVQATICAAPAWADNLPVCGQTPPDPSSGSPYDSSLFGDFGGVRPAIGKYGLSFGLSETDEVLGNPSGGIRRGAIYEGLTDANLKFDLQPHFQWPGAFCVRAFQIHGRGLSANNIGNLITASSIEATPSTRLFEFWYEQQFGDWLHLRLGQQAADQEFLISTTSRLFVNATFGFPTLPANDLPSGGPAFPLGTPAARLRIDPAEGVVLLAGVFNGDPAGPGAGLAQVRDASGTSFRTGDGVLAMFEAQYNPGNSDKNGTYKIGAWFNSERFPDQHFADNGVSLASPLSSGMPRLLGDNYSFYGIIDQPIYATENGGLAGFVRAMGAPDDRNLVNFYFDTGIAFKGPFGRKDDTVGIAFGYAQIGGAARQLDRDTAAIVPGYPVRGREALLEVTYQIQVNGWWQLQPDFQYVMAPQGGVPNPNAPGRKIGNAAVLGLRSTITF